MIYISTIIAGVVILGAYIITKREKIGPEKERRSQYECGIELIEERIGQETTERQYIRFYYIAMIFLIFDLESLLLYPGVLIYRIETSTLTEKMCEIDKGYNTFIVFIILLIIGLIYEYKKKVLE